MSHRYNAQRTGQTIRQCQHRTLLNSLNPLLTFITSVVEHFGATVTDSKADFNSVKSTPNPDCCAHAWFSRRGKARRQVYRDKLRKYTSIHSHTHGERMEVS